MFSFNFDQEIAANASYDFFKNQKLSLVGQGLSFEGFFLGPLHNWIQFVPYGICNLRPDCTPYFFAAAGIISGLVFYTIALHVFNRKIAFISLLIYIFSAVNINSERGPSSNYFLFLASTLLLFCLNKYYQGNSRLFVLGGFIGGLAVVNFNPIFIFTLSAYFISGTIKPGVRLKTIFWSAVLAAVNVLPLLIFNFRHGNIIYSNFVKFLMTSSAYENLFDKFIIIVFKIAIPYYSNFYFHNNSIIFLLITLGIVIISFRYPYKGKQKIHQFLIIWILAAVFGFIFYKRHIPDYYFIQTIPAVILLTATVLSKKLVFFLTFISVFLYANIYYLFNSENPVNYEFKKRVVDYIISDSNNKKFNVYFNFPQGQNTGFNYLFKIKDKIPEDYAETLYLLDFYDDKSFNTGLYYKSFGSNLLKITKIESMKIIKVKAEPIN